MNFEYNERMARKNGDNKRSTGREDRRTVDFRGLIKAIEEYRSDPGWRNLSFSAKVRTMIETLIQMKQGQSQGEETIADLIDRYWQEIIDANIDLTVRRIRDLRDGAYPEDRDLMELSAAIPIDVRRLTELRAKTFKDYKGHKNGEPNGEPCTKL